MWICPIYVDLYYLSLFNLDCETTLNCAFSRSSSELKKRESFCRWSGAWALLKWLPCREWVPPTSSAALHIQHSLSNMGRRRPSRGRDWKRISFAEWLESFVSGFQTPYIQRYDEAPDAVIIRPLSVKLAGSAIMTWSDSELGSPNL